MGLSSSVSRGHYRPLGIVGGRSPSFIFAALFVGLCILSISYWRLGVQYNDLEDQLRKLLQKKDSLEANESFISKQLELREEHFSVAKVRLQKKEKEVSDLTKRLDDQDVKLKDIQNSLEKLKQTNDDLKSRLNKKETELETARHHEKELQNENIKLKSDLDVLKTKLASIEFPVNDNKLGKSSKISSVQSNDNSKNLVQQKQYQSIKSEPNQYDNQVPLPPQSVVPAGVPLEQNRFKIISLASSEKEQLVPQKQIKRPIIKDQVYDFVNTQKKKPQENSLAKASDDHNVINPDDENMAVAKPDQAIDNLSNNNVEETKDNSNNLMAPEAAVDSNNFDNNNRR